MICRTVLIFIIAVNGVSCVPAQNASTSGPQLHTRQAPPRQVPNEQLLPDSSVAAFAVPNPKKYPQKYSAVYMPISLAEGRVRTPEFSVEKRSELYDLMLQFEKPLPFGRMKCMVGTMSDPFEKKDCEEDDPILGADWTVWEDGRIVQWGSIPNNCGCIFTNKNIFKMIGMFPLEAGNKYVVQVHFTKDGSPLNTANPHLIVIPHLDMW